MAERLTDDQLFEKACRAHARDAAQMPQIGGWQWRPSKSLSTVDLKYVHLRDSAGHYAKYVIASDTFVGRAYASLRDKSGYLVKCVLYVTEYVIEE